MKKVISVILLLTLTGCATMKNMAKRQSPDKLSTLEMLLYSSAIGATGGAFAGARLDHDEARGAKNGAIFGAAAGLLVVGMIKEESTTYPESYSPYPVSMPTPLFRPTPRPTPEYRPPRPNTHPHVPLLIPRLPMPQLPSPRPMTPPPIRIPRH